MKKNTPLLIILIAVLMTAFFIYNDVFQVTEAQASTLIAFIPSFALFAVTVWVFNDSRGVLRTGAFIMAGVAVAYFLGVAYTEEIINDTMLQDLTIAQFQTLVISASVLVGSVLYLSKK